MADRSAAEITRLMLLFAAIVLLCALSRPRPVWVVGGALLVLTGEATRVWAAGHLRKTTELITSGPYRYTRNPLYLGRLLIFTGLGIMAWFPYGLNLIVLIVGWLIFFSYYMPRKERIEPARLEGIHGEAFVAYKDAVPALFPRLTPWHAGSKMGWRTDRVRENRELLTLAGLLLIVFLFAARAFALLP